MIPYRSVISTIEIRSPKEITVLVKRPPTPVMVTIRDNKDYIGVLFYSYYTTITGREVLLKYWAL